jgi:RND family efflux transporter MFP subunit
MKEISLPSKDIGRTLQRGAVGVVLLLSLAFLIVYAQRSQADHQLAHDAATTAQPTVDVVAVNSGAAGGSLTLPGETAAWYESTIYARVSGYVAKWYVNIGDHVGTGELLASIDTPELDAELAAARAKLQVAQAQVKVKAAGADFAKSTDERWRDSPRGVVSEQEREDKKAGDASAEAQLEAARAQVTLDRADVDRLTALQQFKRVVAPYRGTITQRRIDIGDLVTADSSASTTPLYRMVQDDPMRVFVDVPQSAIADLMKVGVPARISSLGAPGSSITGSIARTSNAVDPRARTFRAEVDVPNPDRRLVPGQYVQVAFSLQNRGLSQVPATTLVFRSGDPEVAKVARDGSVHFENVTIARDDGDTVELSSGVSKSDRLVLNINSAITEGEKVRVSAAAAAAASGPAVAMRAR